MKVLLEIQYLPSLDYFTEVLKAEALSIEVCETYQKQSYRNRCRILTAQGVQTLTLPVKEGTRHTPIREVRLDHGQKWQQVHWRAITSAYGKAPYYEYFIDYFDRIYRQKHVFLFDFNLSLLTLCLDLMRESKKILFTNEYQKGPELRISDIEDKREQIHPKKPFVYEHKPYTQLFGSNFVPNLSVLDILFCQGSLSASHLRSAIEGKS